MHQHLRDAAQRRHQHSLQRATEALTALSAAGAPITFASVAREASISTDFLYRQPELRIKIQQMRTQANTPRTANADETAATGPSAPVRALSAQLKDLRRRYSTDTTALRHALAVTQGENLALRRKLAIYE